MGAKLRTKSAKERSAALPIRMFGGSPMRVDAPPMFEAITCVSRKGIGEVSRASAIRNVTGTMSITVVTLSRNAERKAVTSASRMSMRPGFALPHWALFMARYSKTPVRSRMATITIIPARSPMVFQSTNSVAACSWSDDAERDEHGRPEQRQYRPVRELEGYEGQDEREEAYGEEFLHADRG